MFSIKQKRYISGEIQKILRSTGHSELPEGEIHFKLRVQGEKPWSWAEVKNNGAVKVPDTNLWNEMQDK